MAKNILANRCPVGLFNIMHLTGQSSASKVGIGKMHSPVLFESSLSFQKHLNTGTHRLLLCLQGLLIGVQVLVVPF